MKFIIFNLLAIGAFFVLFTSNNPTIENVSSSIKEDFSSSIKAALNGLEETKPTGENENVGEAASDTKSQMGEGENHIHKQKNPATEIENWVSERKIHKPSHSGAATNSWKGTNQNSKKTSSEEGQGASTSSPTVSQSLSTKVNSTNQEKIVIEEGGELMTPRERQDQLHNLAQSMELFFLDKINR
ncbi:MAG: hypothetical protein P8J29_06915 [Rhodospirillales bacterium]|nr:hypothetical protein [Rhodospirillales bacterium]